MTDAELASVKQVILEKLQPVCWSCSQQDWLIFPTVLGEAFYDANAQFLTSAYLAPKVRLTCRNCGNIAYFSAESMGLNTEVSDG